MAKLIVKDPKTGVEREMTERSFNLAGQKRGWVKIGTVPEPKSDIQKLMDEKIAERAPKQAEQLVEKPVQAPVEIQQIEAPKKRGPKPKNTEA